MLYLVLKFALEDKSSQVHSHTIEDDGKTAVTGTILIKNCDKDTLKKSVDKLSNSLTQKVTTDESNAKSKVEISQVKEQADGKVAVTYKCTGVSDKDTAKDALTKAVKHEDVQKIISKSATEDTRATKKTEENSKGKSSWFLVYSFLFLKKFKLHGNRYTVSQD